MFQCRLLSRVPACASMRLHFQHISIRCGCFQAWSSTLCALNEFICIVLPVFCTTLHIHEGRGAKHTADVWLKIKNSPIGSQFLLLFPMTLNLYLFLQSLSSFYHFLWDQISHCIYSKVLPSCHAIFFVHLVPFVVPGFSELSVTVL